MASLRLKGVFWNVTARNTFKFEYIYQTYNFRKKLKKNNEVISSE